MPEIIEIFQCSPTNNSTSWVSEILNFVAVNYIIFTTYCDEDYDIKIEWSFTSDFINIIDIDSQSIIGGNSNSLRLPIKAKYARFTVENIAATPNRLCTQGFFFE
jgi:hypothetical protein